MPTSDKKMTQAAQPDLSGAVDLSRVDQTPPGSFLCDVEEGCGLEVKFGVNQRKHETVSDCLTTCLPYVYKYMDLADQATTLANEYKRFAADHERLAKQNSDLVDANLKLVNDNDSLRQEVKASKK